MNTSSRCNNIQTKLILSTIDLAVIQLRVIYWIPPDVISTVFTTAKDSCCIPLYLGADLLRSSHSRTENLPRIHSNYAKQGLATKLFLDAVSIKGIHGTANGVWFYSIQGVFKVAFELLSKDCQKAILTELQDTWLARYNDQPLISSLEVNLQHVDSNALVNYACDVTQSILPVFQSSDNCKCFDVIAEIVKKVIKEFCLKLNYPTNSPVLSTLEKILAAVFFLFYQRKWKVIPWSVLIQYAHMIRQSNCQQSALQLYCEWIGREFSKMQPSVNAAIDVFKARHIHCIDDLPPAKEIINIFPVEMRELLLGWMSCNKDDRRESKLPVLQLVLEFLNQTLITGVSHVVYSKLLEHYDSREK